METYGPVGSGVKAGGKKSPWREGEPLYEMLDDYNNGLLCAPSRDVVSGAPALPGVQIPEMHPELRSVPRETRLLANYPNPFNPETWIPFELAKDANVQIHIYDVSGRLVRTLNLGYCPVGYYVNRSKAGYWDGRNSLGERVVSGLYMYRLTSGDFSAIRRMVIMK